MASVRTPDGPRRHILVNAHLAVIVDARVCLVALTFTLVSALLFGIIPARKVWDSRPLQAMKSGPVDAMPLRRFTPRDLLLGAQIAICILLVTASLVAVRGMVQMLHAPIGFQPRGVVLADVDFSLVEGGNVPLEKKKAMVEALRDIPGVTAAGALSRSPLYGGLRGIPVFPPGTTEFILNNSVLSPYGFTISPGYLETAGTQLLEGRDVSWRDTKMTPYVAIVNQTFARKMWGKTPAIGQRFIFHGPLERSRGRSGGRQVSRNDGVATAGGLSAVVAKRADQADFRSAVESVAERNSASRRTSVTRARAGCANHR
jgi:hypothetical protein